MLPLATPAAWLRARFLLSRQSRQHAWRHQGTVCLLSSPGRAFVLSASSWQRFASCAFHTWRGRGWCTGSPGGTRQGHREHPVHAGSGKRPEGT